MFSLHQSYNDLDDHLLFGFEIGRIAQSLAMGHGFANPMLTPTGPTAWMTPVYPYLLAGVSKFFGVFTESSAFAILSINSLFSAPIHFRLFRRGAKLRSPDGERGRVARAVWPYSVYLASSFIWETCLSALLFACIFLAALKMRARWEGRVGVDSREFNVRAGVSSTSDEKPETGIRSTENGSRSDCSGAWGRSQIPRC